MLLVGDKNQFAIQSRITQAYERLSFRALGHFLIFLNGRRFGVEAQDATMLACSLEMTARRLKNRGRHITPFANATAAEIATEYRHAIYSPESTNENIYFDLRRREFINVIKGRQLQWAPDGDEAFDDGSYILQFDVNDDIRLIGFKAPKDPDDFSYDREDVRMPGEIFYALIGEWLAKFRDEWNAVPKISEAQDGA